MRNYRRLLIAAALVLGSVAQADPNDFRIYRLGNPLTGGASFSADGNANFRSLTRELGAAITSVNLSPPSTLGHAGFAINAELSVVDLKTQSFAFPSEREPSGPLLIPSLHVRKGLPFSLEVGARAAWLDRSRMAAATFEAKWAITEGFSYLPDVGLRGYVTHLFNTRDFQLSATGLDLGVGKRFAIGGTVTLTPYAGWNPVWVGASSSTVDFDTGRSQESELATPTAPLQNTSVYKPVEMFANGHNRFYGGVRFVGGVILLGAEVSYSALGGFHDADSNSDKTLPSVLTFNTTLGLDF